MNRLIHPDELFQAKVIHEKKVIAIYDKVLRLVHQRIKQIANLSNGFTECSYTIPRFIIGIPPYDFQGCLMYIITSLIKNGFRVQYYEPQLIHISWEHWKNNYEISNQLIKQQQQNLIKNKMEERKRINIANQQRQANSQRINIQRLQSKSTSVRIPEENNSRNINISGNINQPKRVRFSGDQDNHTNGYIKNVNMDNTATDQNFYELEQIKKIQMLANQN
jgi:hypothetical protein